MERKREIISSIAIAFLLICVIAMGTIGDLGIREAYREANQMGVGMITNIGESEEREFLRYQRLVSTGLLLYKEYKKENPTEEEVELWIKTYVKAMSGTTGQNEVGILAYLDGKWYVAGFKQNPYNYRTDIRDWYTKTKALDGEILLSDVFKGKLGDLRMISYAVADAQTGDFFSAVISQKAIEESQRERYTLNGATYLLCDKEDNIFYHSTPDAKTESNFDHYSKKVLAKIKYGFVKSYGSVNDVSGRLENSIENIDGQKSRIFVYKLDNGWKSILIMPEHIMVGGLHELSKAFKICVIFFGVFAIVMFLVIYRIKHNNIELAIRNALEKQYYCNYYINLQDYSYFIYKDQTTMLKMFGDSGDARISLHQYLDHRVDEENKKLLEQFFDLTTVQKRMEKEDTISCEYKSSALGWCRVKFLTVDRDTDGIVQGILLVVESIDKAKKKEMEANKALKDALLSANQANQAKTEFLSHMSHDIRTPMNVVLGMTDVALFNIDHKEKVQDCLVKIKKSGKHLLALINKVLDMSKIENRTLKLEVSDFNLYDVLQQTIEMIRPEIEQKKQTIQIQIEDITDAYVYGDQNRIVEICMNILGNAVKYTAEGGKIAITARELEQENKEIGRYQIQVADNGMGMPKEFLQHIFEPFLRVEDSRTSKIEGTGLGMAIVYNLVTMMQGTIDVESELGEGSVFTVMLPLRKSDNKSQIEKKEESDYDEHQITDFSGKRVLLVEDQEFNMEIATEFLEMSGVIVETAMNGKEAVEKVTEAEEFYYDLILMDIQMPIMDGYEATQMIRKSGRKDAASIPIVAMTANAFVSDIADAKRAGMNAHVAKPIDLTKIQKVLRQYSK